MTIAFTVAIGCFASFAFNAFAWLPGDLAVERYRATGVLRADDMPKVDAPPQFVARMRRRDRASLVGSLIAVALLAATLAWTHIPAVQAAGFAVLVAVLFGRGFARAVLSGREICTVVAAGPSRQVSVNRTGRISDHISVGPFVALTVLEVLYLATSLALAHGLAPGLDIAARMIAGVSLVFTAVGWIVAFWLGRQPVPAADLNDMRWSKAVRSDDLTGILMFGPLVASLVAGLPFLDASLPLREEVVPLALAGAAYLTVFLTIAIAAATRRRRQTRTEDPLVDR